MRSGDGQLACKDGHEFSGSLPGLRDIKSSTDNPGPSSLTELFGYFEDSKSNTMALLRRVSSSSKIRESQYSLHVGALITTIGSWVCPKTRVRMSKAGLPHTI